MDAVRLRRWTLLVWSKRPSVVPLVDHKATSNGGLKSPSPPTSVLNAGRLEELNKDSSVGFPDPAFI